MNTCLTPRSFQCWAMIVLASVPIATAHALSGAAQDGVVGVSAAEDAAMPVGALAHLRWLDDNGITALAVHGRKPPFGPNARANAIDKVAISPGSDKIALLNQGLPLKCYRIGSFEHLFDSWRPEGLNTATSFSPDGRWLAVGQTSGHTFLVNTATGKVEHKLSSSAPSTVGLVRYLDDGRRMLVVTHHSIDVWDDLSRRASLAIGIGVRRLAAGADLVVHYEETDETIHVWQVKADPRVLKTIPAQPKTIHALAVSPDGKTLAVGHRNPQGTIGFWDISTLKERLRTRVNAGDDVFDVRRIQPWGVGIRSLAYAPDGSLVASGGFDGAVRLWDAATGKELGCYQGHAGAVGCLEFSADGSLLVSGDDQGNVLMWDPRLRVREGRVQPLSVRPAELEQCWTELRTPGLPPNVYRAFWKMVAGSGESVPFLRERLRPLPGDDPGRIAALVAALGSERFVVREQASQDLAAVAEIAEPFLRRALAGQPNVEARQRIEKLLKNITPSPDLEQLRWGVRVLEAVNNPQSHELLKSLGDRFPDTWLAGEAGAALARLSTKNRDGK